MKIINRLTLQKPATLALAVVCCDFIFLDNVYGDVNFDWATVGNVRNAADTTTLGSVDHVFRISKHEVTNAQYTEFLNAIDAGGTNPNGVYNANIGSEERGGISLTSVATVGSTYVTKPNMGNEPVNFVSFFDAMRFTNWLENGQPTDGSGTESGAYTIGTGLDEIRSPGTTHFIPSEDEWYKVAYHHPAAAGGDADDYWLYPTGTNQSPSIAIASVTGDISNPGTNIVNHLRTADWNGEDGNVTSVGTAGAESASFYGTLDQGGNVWELNEAVNLSFRGRRGGSWDSRTFNLASSHQPIGVFAGDDSITVGFRIASIPEPRMIVLVGIGNLLMPSLHRWFVV